MRGLLFVSAGIATGCAQLAGIDKTTGEPSSATLQLDRVSIGATVAVNPQALDTLTAMYLPEIGDPIDAEVTDPGVWSAQVGTTVPPILFTLPDATTALFAFSARALHASYAVLEHPNPTAPPPAAALDVSVTLDAATTAGETFQLYEVGTWATHALTSPAVGSLTVGPQTIDYTSVTRLSTQPLAAITPDDVVLVLRHTGNALTGAAELVPTTPQGDVTNVAVTMVNAKRDQQLAATIDPVAFETKLVGISPSPTSALAMGWTLAAAPGLGQLSVAGPTLLSGTPAMADATITGAYANPFVPTHPWPSVLTFSAARTRTFTPMGGTALTLSTTLVELGEPAAMSAVGLTAPVPTNVSIGGTTLSTDGLTVALDPTEPVVVTYTAGPATVYEVALLEVTAQGLVARLTLAGEAPSWSVPASYFEPGHTYVLHAVTIAGGYTDIEGGDLSQLTGTIDVATHDGGVFQVMQ